jgi:IS1 family transposase
MLALDFLTAQAYIMCMNKLSREKRIQIVNAIVEGNSIRATARMCDVAFNTVLKFIPEIGKACADYQDTVLRNLTCKRIQCDEIWNFCYAKEKNVPAEMKGKFGYGDVWTWVAIDADTKLVPTWLVGKRDAGYAYEFIGNLSDRLANRVQLTTDGHRAYMTAVEDVFGIGVDYAMLVKLYGDSGTDGPDRRYSQGEVLHARKEAMIGNPDMAKVSTSYVERQNLTMRMSNRRFTRLTNGFSKKIDNLKHSVALHFMHYNFCRIHNSLRVTPAMQAGVTAKLWEIGDIVDLLDSHEAKKAA